MRFFMCARTLASTANVGRVRTSRDIAMRTKVRVTHGEARVPVCSAHSNMWALIMTAIGPANGEIPGSPSVFEPSGV
jgi:hypothetical protein